MGSIQQFGDLNLQFTSQFDFRWNDDDSGGDHDGGFWHPAPPSGFHALGSIGLDNYSNPNGNVAALCVAEFETGNGALAKPTDYQLIWADHGSGAGRDGSCWRPISPNGYVALGVVFVKGYNKPSRDDIVCVKRELTQAGTVGAKVWNTRGTGSDKDFGVWKINVSDDYIDSSKGLIAPNTLVGVASRTTPQSDPVLHCLGLPLPTHAKQEPHPPTLTSRSRPPAQTSEVVDHVVILPFTAIQDPAKTVQWKLANSPFYEVERRITYRLIIFNDNRTNTEQTQKEAITVGVTKTESESFSITTGVSVTAQGGVSFLGTGGSVSATVSVELGWETSTSISEFQSSTVERQLTTAPNTAAAMWATSYSLQVLRADGSSFAQPLTFDILSFYQSQYPEAGQ